MYDPVSTWLANTPSPFNLSEPRETPEYSHYVLGNGKRIAIRRVLKKHGGAVTVENHRGARVDVPYDQLRGAR